MGCGSPRPGAPAESAALPDAGEGRRAGWAEAASREALGPQCTELRRSADAPVRACAEGAAPSASCACSCSARQQRTAEPSGVLQPSSSCYMGTEKTSWGLNSFLSSPADPSVPAEHSEPRHGPWRQQDHARSTDHRCAPLPPSLLAPSPRNCTRQTDCSRTLGTALLTISMSSLHPASFRAAFAEWWSALICVGRGSSPHLTPRRPAGCCVARRRTPPSPAFASA